MQLKVGGQGISLFDGPNFLESWMYVKLSKSWTVNMTTHELKIHPGNDEKSFALGCKGKEREISDLMTKHALMIREARVSADSPRAGASPRASARISPREDSSGAARKGTSNSSQVINCNPTQSGILKIHMHWYHRRSKFCLPVAKRRASRRRRRQWNSRLVPYRGG